MKAKSITGYAIVHYKTGELKGFGASCAIANGAFAIFKTKKDAKKIKFPSEEIVKVKIINCK